MPSHNEFTWKLEASIVEKTDSPTTLFEKFFTQDILEHICVESIKYAKFKGRQNFHIDVDTLKAFITLLLRSGYVDLQRCPMFGENTADVQNIAISSLKSRNRFDEIM